MKNHFNTHRFGLLFKKFTAEHYKSYLMSLAVLVGALALVMGLAAYLSGEPLNIDIQGVFFVFFLLVAGTIFTSNVFADLGDRKKAIAYLTLPASSFEKYMVGWVYSFLIFLIGFTAAFYLVACLIVGMDNRGGAEPELLNLFSEDKKVYLTFLFYACLHAIALVGAIFFVKGHFIKTAFTGLVFFLLLVLLNRQVLGLVLGRELTSAFPFGGVRLLENEQTFSLSLPDQVQDLALWVPALLALILWAAAYYKLKEKQV